MLMKNTLAKLSKPWGLAASWTATLLVPVVLLFLGLRIVASNFFLDVEYRLPHFPADTYGFTLEQRLEYANLCIQYLTTNADISLLGDLTFEDGSPLFKAGELSHMEDVKAAFMPVTNLGFGLTLILFGLLLVAQRRPWRADVIRGIQRGGWLTLGLVLLIGVVAALSFWTFFESFHALFFEDDSWMFLYSDTLIRLFPLQFWQDIVLWLFGIAGGLGLLLGLLLRPKGKPKAR